MNDSDTSPLPQSEPIHNGNGSVREEIPQFGAVDIVEAFTAMRHEWRGQTKESRSLSDQIQAAVTSLLSLESKLLASVNGASVSSNRKDNTAEVKPLVMLLIETDHQLSRAVASIAQWEANRRQRETAEQDAIKQCVAAMNSVSRWFSRPLLALLAGQQSAHTPAENSPALDGLNMIVAKLRRMMREQGIERLDVLGQPFDANTMHAIGAVTSTEYPAGYVAEQLSSAYLWQGQCLRFADVRVANHKAASPVSTVEGQAGTVVE